MITLWRAAVVAAFFALGLGPLHAAAEAPSGLSEAPVLRIETGMHTAKIGRIAIHAGTNILASASYDKTLRLWSLADGRLIRTLRVPIGEAREGALYGVAISPDGGTIATAGWTGEWGDPNWSLYLFEIASGEMIRRVADLPHRGLHLAFSPDGRHLAVTIKNGHGVRVYRVPDFSLAADLPVRHPGGLAPGDENDIDDPNCGDSAPPYLDADNPEGVSAPSSGWAEFDAQGCLVTVSLDGSIRLFDSDFNLIRARRLPGGEWPTSANFSPDDKFLAVGYSERQRVDVLLAEDLSLQFCPKMDDVDNGDMWRTVWSHDGRYLYAGGEFERAGQHPVRRWDDGGRGEPEDVAAASAKGDTYLVPRAEVGVYFASSEPALGAIDEHHNKLFEWRSRAADFRGMGSDFKLSADGSEVYISLQSGSDAAALFALGQRALILDPPSPGADFTPPILNTTALKVANWQGSYAPTLNGAALALLPYERAESYAVAPDESGILLGTRWRVVRYGADAREMWSFQAPGETWALNITPDSRLAVGAFGDGSIRWYRMRDGAELLALFANKDGGRWVAWTPAGYYVASPGGDSLVGWHVNRGPDKAADFFAVGRFRDVYYRPDIVRQALDHEAPETPANIGDLLPPVVVSLALDGGAKISAPRVTLALSVRAAPGDTLRAIQVRADGRPIAALEGNLADLADGALFELSLTVPRHDSEITVVAEGTRGTVSEAARLSLRWKGGAADKRPNLYLLAVGVSRYAAEELRISFAHQDARDFAEILLGQDGRAYGKVHLRVLIDDEASGAALRDGLAWLTREARAGDIAALFLAGHGVDDADGRYFFLPHDVNPARLAETALPYGEIKQALTSLSARSLLFVDTCRAGGVWGRPGEPSSDVVRVVNDLSSPENGVIVFASSTHAQLSVENADWENGAFTEALLEGLDGSADLFGDGEVTVSTLDAYISRRVKKLTAGRQTPAVGKPVEADFPLALLSADAGE